MRNSFPTCEHCGRTGNTKAKCFKIIGYPKEWIDRRKCYICGKVGHIKKNVQRSHKETRKKRMKKIKMKRLMDC